MQTHWWMETTNSLCNDTHTHTRRPYQLRNQTLCHLHIVVLSSSFLDWCSALFSHCHSHLPSVRYVIFSLVMKSSTKQIFGQEFVNFWLKKCRCTFSTESSNKNQEFSWPFWSTQFHRSASFRSFPCHLKREINWNYCTCACSYFTRAAYVVSSSEMMKDFRYAVRPSYSTNARMTSHRSELW